ncbi:MAG: HEPN domain-containing protein [Chloroflexota bacterium]
MTVQTEDMVKNWLTRAERDLATADWILQGPELLHAGSFCHAECAAEKALKAYLASRGQPVSSNQELSALLNECRRLDDEFAQLTSAVDSLVPLAGRYSTGIIEASPERAESQTALELAVGIVTFVRARL